MGKSKFSVEPPEPKSPEEFISGAAITSKPGALTAVEEGRGGEGRSDTGMIPESFHGDPQNRTGNPGEKAWDRFDRRATAKHFFNLRLNDYYYEIVKHLAAQDREASMQKIIKRILLPELERLAGEGK